MKRMNDKIFLDTNVILYLYYSDELQKNNLIMRLLEASNTYIISTQVLNEFINVMTKKKKVSYEHVSQAILELTKAFTISVVTISTIELALQLASKNNYSFFDCLILASALESECDTLYTEDMHHKHIINDSLRIVNPFKLL